MWVDISSKGAEVGSRNQRLAAVLCCVCGGGGEVYPRRSSWLNGLYGRCDPGEPGI